MVSVGVIASREAPVQQFQAGMSEHGFVEGRNIHFETRLAHGDSEGLTDLAQDLVDRRVDLIAVVGAVGARAARSATSSIPIVFAAVVEPAGDGLATSSGSPLANMTGVTTFDPAQAKAQLGLLQAIMPDISTIVYFADSAVSDCLANANLRAAQDAGVRAELFRIVGRTPDLDGAFAFVRRRGGHAIVALEQPAIGISAREIAARAGALQIPSVFARDQAECGGLFSYGTSLGKAARVMARQVSRILAGDPPTRIAIENFCAPELVVDLATARLLGVTIPPEVLRGAIRVNETAAASV